MSKVPAAQQVLAVLRHLARQAGPVPAATIARDLDLPRSTAYQLLTELIDQGFVVHLPEERRYGLGVTAFEIGSAFSRQEPLARLARPLLARLVDAVGHSAHLSVLHGRDVLYVVEERARGRPPLVTDVGVRLPAHLTASGRAVLAGLPAAHVRALFPDRDAFADRTGLGPARLSELRTVLSEVRRRGYATEDGEVTVGFSSVAAAAYDHVGHPVAGIAVTYPSDTGPHTGPRTGPHTGPHTGPRTGPRTEPDPGADADRLANAVRACAADLTRRIGGRRPTGPNPQGPTATPGPTRGP